ncbi:MAG: oxidoreductase, partial [Armatimonadetes bacterium]|nr:oxidoreductase [Armatimonadota bacterium]
VLTEMPVKSALELAWDARLPAGRHRLRGRSWSGAGRIDRVEVSLDSGASWRRARLLEPNFPAAWVRWEVEWEARPGRHRLLARATDDRGRTQPDQAVGNPLGYFFDAVIPHPVRVE